MAEYTIDKFTYGGNTYKLQDNESGYTENGILRGGINVNNNHVPSNLWINWQGDRLEEETQPIYNFGIDLTNNGQSLYQPIITINRSIDNGQNWTNVGTIGGGGGGGTVTSVRVQATSPVQSSTSTAQTSSLNTTISLANGYGDTKNPYGSKTANYILAAPNGSNGVPSFRALVAADIPDLSGTYSTIQNLVDGTATGSIRQINAYDDTNYPLGRDAAAFGKETKATSARSHAEGYGTTASGNNSHAEGSGTTASGTNSHAEGAGTEASGANSHASGWFTTVQSRSQTAIGEYNILDTTGTASTRGDYAFIIGNGTSSARSNAFTVAWNGVATASDKMVCADMSSTEIENFCDGLFNGNGLLSTETITLWNGILGNE